MQISRRRVLHAAVATAIAIGAYFGWQGLHDRGPGDGFISGNGRIEATEIDIATKLGGRVQDVLVREGDFVTAGQVLAHMQIDTLQAQRREAKAQHRQAANSNTSAKAQIALRESDQRAAEAMVAQRESELDAARRRLARSETLVKEGASSRQEVDDDRARMRSAQAAVAAAKAQVAAAQAAVTAAKAQQTGAESSIAAAQATVERIQVEIVDSDLKAPRDGRVQFRVAQPGEVLGGGGRVLNMIDLSDVYMTFFLPTQAAGRVAIGQDVHIILDAAPQFVIPAKITFVSSAAQFTPKAIETQSEREKLMFRVRAQIDPGLLQQHLKYVKTGLPGVAWVKLNRDEEWPTSLQIRVP